MCITTGTYVASGSMTALPAGSWPFNQWPRLHRLQVDWSNYALWTHAATACWTLTRARNNVAEAPFVPRQDYDPILLSVALLHAARLARCDSGSCIDVLARRRRSCRRGDVHRDPPKPVKAWPLM